MRIQTIFYGTLAFLLMLNSPVKSKIQSLLFTHAERKQIALKRHQQLIQDPSSFTCTGYSYTDAKQWSIWLNQKSYSQAALKEIGFMVTDVQPQGVVIKTPSGSLLLHPGITLSQRGEILNASIATMHAMS